MTAAVDLYQLDTDRLAGDTEREVLAVYARWLAGELATDITVVTIAGIINRANAAATALADTWLALQIEAQTRTVATTVGVLAVDHSDRLVKAARTVLAEPDTAEPRLSRLARAEPLESAQQAIHDAMQEQKLVEGWTRQMDGDPCQLCRWWSRDGRIWPKQHPFQRHKGCNCQPRIVIARNIKSTGYTREMRETA